MAHLAILCVGAGVSIACWPGGASMSAGPGSVGLMPGEGRNAMCGRYVSVAHLRELRERYRATGAGDGAELAPSHNVAPTNKVYAVLERGRMDGAGAERQVRAVRWGLVPAWWKPGIDPKTNKQKAMPSLHNARADKVATAP